MLVQCPECTTKYNLDETRIGENGTKVRCTRCKHVFTAFKPMPDDDIQDLFEPVVSEPETKKAPPAVDQDMLADLEGAFQQPLIDPENKNPLLDVDAKPQKQKKSSSVLLVLFLILLLTAGTGAGIYFLRPAWIPWLTRLGSPDTPPSPDKPAATSGVTESKPSPVSQVALENVRQYFVPNEKEGQLFIIEGKATNHFQESKELIKLKASLFDKKGNVVVAQEFMCGNVVSLYQLQVSAKQDIEAALSARVGILTNNTNIQPGSSAPFMVVFFKAPDTVEEFGLEVLQAQTPQKQ